MKQGSFSRQWQNFRLSHSFLAYLQFVILCPQSPRAISVRIIRGFLSVLSQTSFYILSLHFGCLFDYNKISLAKHSSFSSFISALPHLLPLAHFLQESPH